MQVKKITEERKGAAMRPYQLGVFTEKATVKLDKEVKEELRRSGATKGGMSGFLREVLREYLEGKYRLPRTRKAVSNVVTSTERHVNEEMVSFILDSDMKRKLERLAARRGRSFSDFVGEILGEYLKNK